MRLRAAVLCDYAEVRESLLTIVSAGITRLFRDTLPAPFGMFVALQIELDASERRLPHEVQVVVKSPRDGEVAKARGGFQAIEGNMPPEHDEAAIVSLPLDLRGAGIEEYGWHTLEITLDNQLIDTLRFKVGKRPESTAPVPLMNRQARRHTKPN